MKGWRLVQTIQADKVTSMRLDSHRVLNRQGAATIGAILVADVWLGRIAIFSSHDTIAKDGGHHKRYRSCSNGNRSRDRARSCRLLGIRRKDQGIANFVEEFRTNDRRGKLIKEIGVVQTDFDGMISLV